ncbi:MAG: flagellar basal-body MS-ring/collar protein FliF [Christensenellales bacterium]
MNKFLGYFKEMPKAKRVRIFILAALIIVVVIVTSTLLTQKSYSVLYSNLDSTEAGEVFAQLNEMGIDAKAKGSDTILVESAKTEDVRMQLAAQGYPKTGFNYDIWQQASGLGSTEMERRVQLQFQLQEHLKQTIKRMEKVNDAVVLLSMGQESQYVLAKDEKPPSASVLLELSEQITTDEARTIAELVARSIPNLSAEDVIITDSKMNLYAINDTETDNIDAVNDRIALQRSVQATLREQIIELLKPVFGQDKVSAQVYVELDFDTKLVDQVEFAPPIEGNTQGMVRSMENLAEIVQGGTDGEGVAGMDANGTASSYQEILDEQNALYKSVSEKVNYELNETRTQIESAKGAVTDLSIAVIIDSSDEEMEDYSQDVQTLIATGMGVLPERVAVERLPFQQAEDEGLAIFQQQEELMQALRNSELVRTIIFVAAGIVCMLILFLIVRTIMKKNQPEPVLAEGEMQDEVYTEDEGVDYMADEEIIPGNELEQMIEQKDDTIVSQLEDYIDKSPESVAQLLRNWLSE